MEKVITRFHFSPLGLWLYGFGLLNSGSFVEIGLRLDLNVFKDFDLDLDLVLN